MRCRFTQGNASSFGRDGQGEDLARPKWKDPHEIGEQGRSMFGRSYICMTLGNRQVQMLMISNATCTLFV